MCGVRRAGKRSIWRSAELNPVNDDLDQLARLRVAAISGRLPPDLADWTIRRIAAGIDRRAARHQWVPLIRQAAAQMPGSTRAKANELADAVMHLQRFPGLVKVAWYHPSDPSHLLQQALRIESNIPASPRQLRRLIE